MLDAGGDVDDRSTAMLHALLVDLAGENEAPQCVRLEHGVEALLGDFGQQGRELAARAVDQPRDGARLRYDGRDDLLHSRFVADIARVG